MDWIGLDIGGANVKVAKEDSSGCVICQTYPFELWKYPDQLFDFLKNIIVETEKYQAAVTMTGELADGYSCKQHGVEQIVNDVEKLFTGRARYYQTNGDFVGATTAKKQWLETAASNWHALAKWLSAEYLPDGFLLDVGSTTTDVIPIVDGNVASRGLTDFDRLVHGELIYIGAARSSVSGFMDALIVNGAPVPVANELFATIGDARLIANANSGQPVKQDELDRAMACLARLVCSDVSELGSKVVNEIAEQICIQHKQILCGKIVACLGNRIDVPRNFILSGSGESLLVELVENQIDGSFRKLSDLIGANSSTCAPAFAVRQLALKQCHV